MLGRINVLLENDPGFATQHLWDGGRVVRYNLYLGMPDI